VAFYVTGISTPEVHLESPPLLGTLTRSGCFAAAIDSLSMAELGAILDPVLPWLLEDDDPAVRHQALRSLLDRPEDAPEVRRARRAAMRADPIRTILEAQHPDGYWVKPGPGYAPKYTGTVWQLIFLDQLGADPSDQRIRRACGYVLSHTQAESGGFGASGRVDALRPPSSEVVHCLNGNLLRALIGFGFLEDERVGRAIDWEARAITGQGDVPFYQSGTSGPGFRCGINEGLPCGWGASKALLGLARIPPKRRRPIVRPALEEGIEFLLSVDPATALYPMGWGNTEPSKLWFKLGFPAGYQADFLEILEVATELGRARDPRLGTSIELLLSKRGRDGRWCNEHAFNRKTWIDFERQGKPSKWVTLRACRVLRRALS